MNNFKNEISSEIEAVLSKGCHGQPRPLKDTPIAGDRLAEGIRQPRVWTTFPEREAGPSIVVEYDSQEQLWREILSPDMTTAAIEERMLDPEPISWRQENLTEELRREIYALRDGVLSQNILPNTIPDLTPIEYPLPDIDHSQEPVFRETLSDENREAYAVLQQDLDYIRETARRAVNSDEGEIYNG